MVGQVIEQSARFATTGTPLLIDLRGQGKAVQNMTVQVKGFGGAPTTLTSTFAASLDGTNWTTIQAISQANDGTTYMFVDKPTQLLRLNVTALTLGTPTAVDVYITASQ